MTKMHTVAALVPRLEVQGPPLRRISLDDLDALILRELILGDRDLFRSERVSFERIARKLGVHRNTVAQRARRMAAAHAFLPLTLSVEPSQMGLYRGSMWVVPPHDRRTEGTLNALWLVEGLQLVVQYLEGWLVFLYGESEAEVLGRGELVQHLCGVAKATWQTLSWQDYERRAPLRLSGTDVGMIRLLLQNARLPFPRIARVLGISSRTAQRRFERLARNGAIMVLPSGSGRYSGVIFGHLRTQISEGPTRRGQTMRAVDASLPQAVFRNLHHPRFGSWIVVVQTMSDLEGLAAQVRRVAGVRSVEVQLFLGLRLNPRWGEWLLRILERRTYGRP